jgi:hypothetical protein
MTININGKDYDENTFSDVLKNYIIARQETNNNRTRIIIELEKHNVLLDYYNKKINEELTKENSDKKEQ